MLFAVKGVISSIERALQRMYLSVLACQFAKIEVESADHEVASCERTGEPVFSESEAYFFEGRWNHKRYSSFDLSRSSLEERTR